MPTASESGARETERVAISSVHRAWKTHGASLPWRLRGSGVLVPALVLAASGCATGPSEEGGLEEAESSMDAKRSATRSPFGQAASRARGLDCSEMDLLFVVDDSDSMVEEQPML